MSWVAAAVVGGTVVGGALAGNSAKKAAKTAAGAQDRASQLATDEQRRQFDALQKLLKPYVEAGTGALSGQEDILGLNGPQSQQSSVDAIQNSPIFKALVGQGEDALLQNASATGGLRGGNTQAALAEFRPQMLDALLRERFANLGGLVTTGQNSAAMQGSAGMNTANQIGANYQASGQAQAGAALAKGQADANMWNSFSSLPSLFVGMGGVGGGQGAKIGGTSPWGSAWRGAGSF